MSDIGVNYEARTQPERVSAQISMQFVATTLRATIVSVGDFIIVLTPAGNVAEEIISGIAYPIAQILGVALPPLAHGLIIGRSFDVTAIHPAPEVVEGETLMIAADNLTVSNFNGMLLVKGGVSVS